MSNEIMLRKKKTTADKSGNMNENEAAAAIQVMMVKIQV